MTEAEIRALVLSTIASSVKKISALPAASSLEYGDLLATVSIAGLATKKATIGQIIGKASGTFPTAQMLRDLDVTLIQDNSLFYIEGAVAVDDGGEGFFYYDASGVGSDNLGTLLAPTAGAGRFYRLYSGPLNVKWFGAKGDGITDDTAAIQIAIDATPPAGTLLAPLGIYITGALTVTTSMTLQGSGWHQLSYPSYGGAWSTQLLGTVLAFTSTSGSALLMLGSLVRNMSLKDIAVRGPGSGTSIGIDFGSAAISVTNSQLQNVMVANFSKGIRARNLYEACGNGIVVAGCAVGLHLELNCNQNTFNQVSIINCTTTGLKVEASALNVFNGAVLQGNGGTVLDIDANGNQFTGFYFENTGATKAIDIGSTSSDNAFNTTHFGTTDDKVVVAGNRTTFIGLQGTSGTWAVSGNGNYVVGIINSTFTDTGADNVVITPYNTGEYWVGAGAAGFQFKGRATAGGQVFIFLSLPNQAGAPSFKLANASGAFALTDVGNAYSLLASNSNGRVTVASKAGQNISLAPGAGGKIEANLPTSIGAAGTLWNDAGTVKVS